MKNEKRIAVLAVTVYLLLSLILAGATVAGPPKTSPGEGSAPIDRTSWDYVWNTVAAALDRQRAQIDPSSVFPAAAVDVADIDATTDIYDDIVAYDLLVGAPSTVSAFPALKWSPSVYGDHFVWADGRNGVGNRDIYLYDFALGIETQLTTDPNEQYAPVIHGDRVVYIDERSGNEDIYMYDISTGVETPIVTDPAIQISPAIYGDTIAWLDYRNGTYPDVYMYDLSTSTESPVSVHAEYTSPSFSGGGYVSIHEDKIVWYDWHTGNADVFVYDISTGVETQITTDTLGQRFPDIEGDIIVWEDNRNSPLPFDPDTEQKDIYMYDLSTGTESAVSTDPGRDRQPAVHGDHIVWTRDDDLIMYDLATDTESVVEPGAGILATPDIHGNKIVWVGPAPTEPAIKLLYLPLNWTDTQAAFNAAADDQVDFFRDAIPLRDCTEQVAVTTLNVETQNFDTFTCSSPGPCGVGLIAPFVEGLGINTADYTAVVGLVDGTPCWPTRGCSSGGHDVIWADVVRPTTTAHELGHQYGLEDEYCSNPAGSTDCRCNDGDEGDQTWANCDDTGGDGAATGDLNWLDTSLGCDPDSGTCCSGCGGTYPEVCCEGNQNADGGRCIMSYANALDPRAFGAHCRTRLASIAELNCPSSTLSLAQIAPPAPRQIIDVALLVHDDDTVEEEEVILRRGRPSTDHIRGGNYRMEVWGDGGKLMWRQDVDIYFDYYGPVDKGVDYSVVQYETFPLLRRIPYDPEMEELRLYHGEQLIYSRALIFCNQNNICDANETYLTCPNDCPLDKPDGLCLANQDGVCDTDCDKGVDPDCYAGPEQIYIEPSTATVGVGEVVSVTVEVDQVEDLYGVQLALAFDEDIVEVVDADPFAPGTQILPGDFLNPDAEFRNLAKNAEGTIEYSASLQGDKPGVSGSGTLAEIGLRGLNIGRSSLAFTEVVLSDPQSLLIEVGQRDGVLIVQSATQAPFSIGGQVELERRTSNAGAEVCVGANCATTDETGNYSLPNVILGQEVEVTHPSYLRSARTLSDPPTTVGGTLSLPDVTLLGGDVDQNDRIFVNDGALVGMAMDTDPVDESWYHIRDITDDGVVDIRDMVAVQFNWDTRAPGPWSDTVAAGTIEVKPASVIDRFHAAFGQVLGPTEAAQDDVVVRIDPATATVPNLGMTVRLDMVVEDVEDLYAFAVKVRFDPTLLRVRDVNPRTDGTQLVPGDFLDFEHWVILRNAANNETGLAELSITQTGPTPGRDGTGALGSIIFESIGQGTTTVQFEEIELLADDYPNTTPIPSTGQAGTVNVEGDHYIIYLPLVLRTGSASVR